VSGQSVEIEGAVERCGDAGEGFDEGAVEVEDEGFHPAKPKFQIPNFK